MGEITVLLGGARSGKSDLAVELGRAHAGAVVFIATAEPLDADMQRRIDHHRTTRPAWPTIEEPVALAEAVAGVAPDALVIIDCLTVWLGNVLHRADQPDGSELGDDMARMTDRLIGALRERQGPSIVISNEVGMGIHPETSLGRTYRDALGRVNQRVAAAADHALLLIAGRAMRLVDPHSLL
jgi:adenosylcobinamide kinase/adenosylcobinamide-phosphate guanylyltransferase